MKKNKKSILDEALTEYNEIVEAANQNAMKKLANEFPSKFNKLIEQELDSSKKEEPYKVVENEELDTETIENDKTENMEDNKKTEPKSDESKIGGIVEKAIEEEFDITDLSDDAVEKTLDEIEDEDTITIEDIEKEISELESIEDETVEDETVGDELTDDAVVEKLTQMKDELDNMIQSLSGDENELESEIDIAPETDSPTDDVDMVFEDDIISNEDIDEILKDFDTLDLEDEVEESLAHTISHSNARQAGSHNNINYQKKGNLRPDMKEGEENKNDYLLAENKKLTKKLNEALRYKKSANKLIEDYKGALEKYRTQLKEMAIFNTNLAHVNNILVNEELALTQEDKIRIISDFKEIKTITESKDRYRNILSEMKLSTKKTISENIEDKMNTSIQPSSKGRLDEVSEKTLYENNDIFKRMMETINYIEKRGK